MDLDILHCSSSRFADVMEKPMRDYHHPYKPYEIQIQLMDAIYECIADGKIGIFESPTGPLDGMQINL